METRRAGAIRESGVFRRALCDMLIDLMIVVGVCLQGAPWCSGWKMGIRC